MTGGQELLGALILNPALLEAVDLTADDFPPGREREAFAAITQIHEDVRGERIDLVLLGEKLGGDGAATYVMDLVKGNYAGTPEKLRARVALYRMKTITRRVEGTILRQAAVGELDLGEIRPDLSDTTGSARRSRAPRPHSARVRSSRPLTFISNGLSIALSPKTP